MQVNSPSRRDTISGAASRLYGFCGTGANVTPGVVPATAVDVTRLPGCVSARVGNLTRALGAGRSEAVRVGEVRVLAREHLGEVDHHPALLPRRVVLHLAVDHVHAAAVGDGLDDLSGEPDLVRIRAEDLPGHVDLGGVQRPRPDAAHEEGGAELGLAPGQVLDVAEGPVVGEDAGHRAGVDHAAHGVVPQVLLGGPARSIRVVGVG